MQYDPPEGRHGYLRLGYPLFFGVRVGTPGDFFLPDRYYERKEVMKNS